MEVKKKRSRKYPEKVKKEAVKRAHFLIRQLCHKRIKPEYDISNGRVPRHEEVDRVLAENPGATLTKKGAVRKVDHLDKKDLRILEKMLLFEKVSVRAVAAELGITKSAVYVWAEKLGLVYDYVVSKDFTPGYQKRGKKQWQKN